RARVLPLDDLRHDAAVAAGPDRLRELLGDVDEAAEQPRADPPHRAEPAGRWLATLRVVLQETTAVAEPRHERRLDAALQRLEVGDDRVERRPRALDERQLEIGHQRRAAVTDPQREPPKICARWLSLMWKACAIDARVRPLRATMASSAR